MEPLGQEHGCEFDARTDTLASVAVVAIVIASALCGVFVVDVESSTPPERSVTYLARAA
jgi:hypothetical protein